MRILFLDLASASPFIALCTKDSVLASNMPDHRLGDHELLPVVREVLRVASCGFQDLTQIACVIGPGGFMSLRVGVALANTLADQLGIPVAGVHLSDVYAARGQKGKKAKGQNNVVWLHSTKKTELFMRGFGEYEKKWPEAIHMKLEDLLNILRRDVPLARLPWIGELIPEQHETLKTGVGALHAMPLQDVKEILPAFLQNQTFKKQILEPWYGRGW